MGVERMDTFMDRFKLLRSEIGLSQEQLAKKLRLSKAAIGHYETGFRRPDLDTLERIADFFGVSTDYLLGRTPIRNMTTKDIHTADDLKRYLGLDKTDVVRLLFYNGRNSDEIPPEAVESVLEAIEYARWKYTTHGNHTRKGANESGGPDQRS